MPNRGRHHHLQKAWQEQPREPCKREREDQQRKNPLYDDEKRMAEIQTDARIDHRHHRRHHQRRDNVYQNGVAHQRERVAAQLVGHHHGSSGCWADKAHHGAFHNDAPLASAQKARHSSRRHKRARLNERQPQMPSAETYF